MCTTKSNLNALAKLPVKCYDRSASSKKFRSTRLYRYDNLYSDRSANPVLAQIIILFSMNWTALEVNLL